MRKRNGCDDRKQTYKWKCAKMDDARKALTDVETDRVLSLIKYRDATLRVKD